jgi:hypothetical protein
MTYLGFSHMACLLEASPDPRPTRFVHAVDVIGRASSFAVRVLDTDLRLHGQRFLRVEFALSTALSVSLAVAIAVAAIVRHSGPIGAVVAVVFFLGVATNSVAVLSWVTRHPSGGGCDHAASVRDVAVFAVATLLPGGLVVSLRRGR